MVRVYRARPIEFEAAQWTGQNMKELEHFMGQSFTSYSDTGGLLVQIQGKDKRIDPGIWVCKNALGEFWLCENNKFQRENELVE